MSSKLALFLLAVNFASAGCGRVESAPSNPTEVNASDAQVDGGDAGCEYNLNGARAFCPASMEYGCPSSGCSNCRCRWAPLDHAYVFECTTFACHDN